MRKMIWLAALLVTLTLSFLAYSQLVNTEESIWKVNPIPLPTPIYLHASVINSGTGTVYVIGGRLSEEPDPSKNWLDKVYYAKINTDGAISTWTETTPLPEGRTGATAAVQNNVIYVIGGGGPGGGAQEKSTVWYGQANPDGTIGNWIATTSLPYRTRGHMTVVWNGRVYVGGGTGGAGWRNDLVYAEINPDGSLGNWISTTSLPLAYGMMAALVHNGMLYLIGGTITWGGSGLSVESVYSATINSDGSVGSWSTTTQLPEGRAYAEAVLVDNDIYVTGGVVDEADAVRYNVYQATISPDGTIGGWSIIQRLPAPRAEHTSVAYQRTVYVIGGQDDQAVGQDIVYYLSLSREDEGIKFGIPVAALTTGASIVAIFIATVALFKKNRHNKRAQENQAQNV